MLDVCDGSAIAGTATIIAVNEVKISLLFILRSLPFLFINKPHEIQAVGG